MAVLDVRDLSIQYDTRAGIRHAVTGASFKLEPGGYLGIVGESGCGKTTIVRALLGILPPNGRIANGSILFRDRDLARVSESEYRKLRWRNIALVPQSAMNALDPVVSVGDQLVEAIRTHERVSSGDARDRAADAFRTVGLDPRRLDNFAHQMSGGMRQRAMIAMALTLGPDVIIGDEPTTGLDVIMQDQILRELKRLQEERNQAMILVTHNVAAVAENCDHVVVMYGGEVMEYGTTADVLLDSFNPYTLGLRNAFPSIHHDETHRLISIPGTPPSLMDPGPGCKFTERCPFATDLCRVESPPLVEVSPGHVSRCHFPDKVEEFRKASSLRETWRIDQQPSKTTWAATNGQSKLSKTSAESIDVERRASETLDVDQLKVHFPVRQGLVSSILRSRQSWVHAVDGIDITLRRGKTVGLAGESGCGKSTTGMTLARLYQPTSGHLRLGGMDAAQLNGRSLKRFRRRVQMVFQDPYGSLNPRFTVGRAVEEALIIHKIGDAQERRARVEHALSLAELEPAAEYYDRYPHQLSGGQRQRVSIARAIVLEPEFLVADEPVSMLDVSVQAGVLNLLQTLVKELNVGLLYVSHDLSTMRHICDEVAIMYVGQVVEQGSAEEVLSNPLHPYAKALVAAVPVPDPNHRRQRVHLVGEVPSAVDPVPGCRFAPRCPAVMDQCHQNTPALAATERSHGRRVACFLFHDQTIESSHLQDPVIATDPERSVPAREAVGGKVGQ